MPALEHAFVTPTWLRVAQSLLMFTLVAIGVTVVHIYGDTPFGLSLYGIVALPYLAYKMVTAVRYRPHTGPAPAGLKTAVIIPSFNEDPATLAATIESVLGQDHRVDEIWVVDDGSDRDDGFQVAQQVLAGRDGAYVHKLPENRGKRHAQAYAFQRSDADIFITVDSDTILYSDAVAEGLKPFADDQVNAVCGYARAMNPTTNLLTRLIDLRYTNAFLFERAAYSVHGAVICSTGVLSFWRRHVPVDNLDDYLNQSFLGVEVGYGDDRRMTAYALETGKVVLQETAQAITSVPENFPTFAKQQIRWNKSFFRESTLLVRTFAWRQAAYWFGAAELFYWALLTTMLLWAVVLSPLLSGHLPSWVHILFITLMAYARSVRAVGQDGVWLSKAFWFAPAYGLLNLLVLVPLRLYALAQLKDGGWGTRNPGQEHEGFSTVAADTTSQEAGASPGDRLTAA